MMRAIWRIETAKAAALRGAALETGIGEGRCLPAPPGCPPAAASSDRHGRGRSPSFSYAFFTLRTTPRVAAVASSRVVVQPFCHAFETVCRFLVYRNAGCQQVFAMKVSR